jgi:ribose 5-phosphate isomerase B
MTIVIGNDHAGKELKFDIITYLQSKEFEVINVGTDDDISVDYPDYASKVATYVLDKKADLGILICGTGIGMNIAANKFKGIRAANIYDKQTARLAKEHNFANVITFGARTHVKEQVFHLLDTFMMTEFETRHQKRIDKINEIEGI